MNWRPPVSSLRQRLPFDDPAFGWDTFEDFFCDFFNARPEIVVNDRGTEVRRRMILARPYGRRGDSQLGLDLIAEMEGGEEWHVQCKHYQSGWTPSLTRKAIEAYQGQAARKFLVVTREVSEECYEIVAQHPGWTLWDAREIDRRFRKLSPLVGAPILFTHFGPGWAEAFFGVSGDGPLVGADVKYAPQLREGIRFHHRHAMIGRQDTLDRLDGFTRDKTRRVFLLVGRGGLGKSRLLLEWGRQFHQRHPDRTLRFLSDTCVDFGPTLQIAPKPLTLVFDDAHRLDDVRRALFPELPRREEVQLVLALRPGPTEQIVRELLEAGFDSTEIVRDEPMRSLTHPQALDLVDKALKPEFAGCRQFLANASSRCPLIAVIGAELINSGALTSPDFLNAAELQRRVFESLLHDARSVRDRFGESATDDFLCLLALLGPVKLDATFFSQAAPFLGLANPDQVSRLRDALDSAGLLLTTGAGTRVTPDLLSDHLAYIACYDRAGQSRGFADRLLSQFSAAKFPKLLQHLAEAEWRALRDTSSAGSVVEPLWQWFQERFRRSSFFDRRRQIEEWATIAHLQPERSLELARLAESLATAPADDETLPMANEYDTHEHTLGAIPPMLANVAQQHPDYLGRCFDLLWQLGRQHPPTGEEAHPVSVASEVVAYRPWKSLEVQNAAVTWLEQLLAAHRGTLKPRELGWLLRKLLEPLLETSIEESWWNGRTVHLRSLPLHLHNTAPLRGRVRQMCRTLLTRRDPHLVIELIPLLGKGCDVARMGFGESPSAEFRSAWNAERLENLRVLGELTQTFEEPLLRFQVRRTLLHLVRYHGDEDSVRSEFRRVVAGLPESLDFSIARTVFGDEYSEFEHDPDDEAWHDTAQAQWKSLLRDVAARLLAALPGTHQWLSYLANLQQRWRTFHGFQPNFRALLGAICETHPEEGITAARILLAEPDHPFAEVFDAVAMSATKADGDTRLHLIREAARSTREEVRAAAIACCAWWQREGELPEEAWKFLETVVPTASPLVAERLVNFIWWTHRSATLRDWQLLSMIPFNPGNAVLAGQIVARAADLIHRPESKPDEASVERLLRRCESLESLDGRDLRHALPKLAEGFPRPVFSIFWRRCTQARTSNLGRPKPLPPDLHQFRFPQVMATPELAAIVEECESRLANGHHLNFGETALLRLAIHTGGDDPWAWLNAAAHRATSDLQLETLCELGSVGRWDNAALADPDFARLVLSRARSLSPDFHDRIFRRMIHVGGGRGSSDGEPDADWKRLLETVERLAHQHAADPELGPLFTTIVRRERTWFEQERRRCMALDQPESE